MKFKPIYLYGIIAIAVVVILIIVSQTNNNEKTNVDITNKEMPIDDVHRKLNERNESESERFKCF